MRFGLGRLPMRLAMHRFIKRHGRHWHLPTVCRIGFQLAAVAAPRSEGSFDTACRAIAAVRKAKHEAKIGLGKPLAKLEMSATDDQLASLRLVDADVADAGGATEIAYQGVETDDGYVASVEAPAD